MEISMRSGSVCVIEWNVDTGQIETFVFDFEYSVNTYVLSAIENVSGDGVDLKRTSNGQLTDLHQRIENRTILVKHNSQGRISSLSLESGEGGPPLVGYEYDSAGRLIAAVNRRGLAHRYEYDDQSRLKREMLPDGAVYTYKYDDKNRCIHFTGLDHYNEKSLKFLDPIGTTILTNSYGVIKTFKSNASGQIELEANPTGAKRETKYDEFGRVVGKVDELGASTLYAYDQFGNRAAITDALGNVTQFTFNQHHQPTSMTDATKQVWKREYNEGQRLTATENPLGARWRVNYDFDGNPIEITEPQGFIRRQRFERGKLIESTDFMDHKSRFVWDTFGRLIERTGMIGEKSLFQYDAGDNVIRVDQPDGSSLQATYDAGGNLINFTNAKGHSTQFRYGSCRRLLERKDALGRSVRYEWGTEPDRLDAAINEKGERFTYVRDDEGRVVLERSFDGREHHFAFDTAGRINAFINGNEEGIQYKHDPMGRLVEQTLPTGEKTSFEFDPIGRMLAAVNRDAEVKFEYDPAGRLVREVQNEHWVGTEYNLTGEVIRTFTSLDHEVKYELDPNGRVVKLTTAKDQSLSFERDARGLEIGREMPGEMRMEQRFDSMGRLLDQRVGKKGYREFTTSLGAAPSRISPYTERIQRDYSYDQGGLLLSIKDAHWGKTEYGYDPAERLLSAFRDKGVSENFEYDATDNVTRMQQQNVAPTESELTYGPGNRIQQCGDTIYGHDTDGRLIRKTESANSEEPQIWEYYWDAQGQMRGLRRPDGGEWNYKYDAFGRRLAKIGPTSADKFLWNGDVIIHEINMDHKIATWLMKKGSFEPLAKVQAGAMFNVINDHLGTPRKLLDGHGKVIWDSTFSVWGSSEQEIVSTNIECPIRFQGQWFDEESGLHYNRFRYYDPRSARYIGPDPIGVSGDLNIFIYVRNPTNWVDPLGLAPCIDSEIEKYKRELASEEQMDHVMSGAGEPIAGAGTTTPLRDSPRLAAVYGGAPGDWAKVRSESSSVHGVQLPNGGNFETHAYQNVATGQVVEPKLKIDGH